MQAWIALAKHNYRWHLLQLSIRLPNRQFRYPRSLAPTTYPEEYIARIWASLEMVGSPGLFICSFNCFVDSFPDEHAVTFANFHLLLQFLLQFRNCLHEAWFHNSFPVPGLGTIDLCSLFEILRVDNILTDCSSLTLKMFLVSEI